MKTRLLSALLAGALTLPLLLAACGSGSDSDTTAPDPDVTTAATAQSGDDTADPGSAGDPVVDDTPYNGIVLKALSDGVYDISDNLFGVFLEDINFAVDGGLYAELVCNRSFEYGPITGNKYAWSSTGIGSVTWNVVDGARDKTWLNENNPHYARVTNKSDKEAGLYNVGFFDDLSVKKDAEYKFSVFARAVDGYTGGLKVTLESGNNVYAEGRIDSITDEWRKYTLTLKSSADVSSNLRLYVRIDSGTVDLDMVSLFPADTYKGRENGLRRDLAEMIEALEPNFFRFPGGCIIEGSTLAKAYSWKDSIGGGLQFEINGEMTVGDVAARPLGESIWSWNWQPYYMTYGLGFYEYFLLCEDLGCAPVPVLNCGMSCQGQPGPNGVETVPIKSERFQEYIQDALDLVEFCMGGTDTYWGGVRAAMGHPDKFDLTYIGIGNEQWGNDYNARYAKFREAFNEAKKDNPDLYGNIKLIMANGPLYDSTDGWDVVAKDKDIADLLDEHYYCEPSWFLLNTDRYDSYDRDAPTVFLGEYAAHSNTALAAMAEAAYMTALERNGDVVELAAYAPLFAYQDHTQWTPDLIWFDKTGVWGSVNYYVQKIFAANQSDRIIPSTMDATGMENAPILTGKVGVGTWQTSARFDSVVVTDTKTGDVLLSEDFTESKVSDFDVISGNFAVRSNSLMQSNTNYPSNDVTGDVLYMGDAGWSSYTLTVKARKTGGAEGFIIPFAVQDKNNFWHWNIGGWGNTVSTLEYVSEGAKSGKISSTVKPFTVENGREYEIKIVVDGFNIKGYIDGELMFDYTAEALYGVYSVVGEDDDSIIVKLVNTTKTAVPVKIDVSSVSSYKGKADTQSISFKNPNMENSKNASRVSIEDGTIDVSGVFEYELGKYSVTVIRIPKGN